MATFDFTTGPATLPDVGELSYNGCTFGPLFATEVSGVFAKDDAGRTTKDLEYTIVVDGYATLPDGDTTVENTLATLERLLSAPAGALRYTGRGIKIVVNTASGDRDVAWGPIPELLDITPMGGGRSAHVKWTVKTRIPPRVRRGATHSLPVLQFCFDTSVSYDEAGYSKLRLSGITEIPLTRTSLNERALPRTADDFRAQFPGQLLQTIDLTRFRIVNREFNVSKDKRTLEFHVEAEELPWMAMPPDVTVARGQFTFKPAKAGMGLVSWLCTLTVTYTVAKNKPRRVAWLAFLALLRIRMQQGVLFGDVGPPNGQQNAGFFPGPGALLVAAGNPLLFTGVAAVQLWRGLMARQNAVLGAKGSPRKVFLVDFSGSEGLYLDSKTVTFSATWRLVTVFSRILQASGLWKKVPGQDENLWAASVRSISGDVSWLTNRLDPGADVIVDFGF